jgi:hypothetical protein
MSSSPLTIKFRGELIDVPPSVATVAQLGVFLETRTRVPLARQKLMLPKSVAAPATTVAAVVAALRSPKPTVMLLGAPDDEVQAQSALFAAAAAAAQSSIVDDLVYSGDGDDDDDGGGGGGGDKDALLRFDDTNLQKIEQRVAKYEFVRVAFYPGGWWRPLVKLTSIRFPPLRPC